MATYAIGDIHGCYDQLQNLLDLIKFDPSVDKLWFTGDLVNGGPKPAEVVRLIKSLNNAVCVLGNHDLVLIAVAAGQLPAPEDRSIGLEPILNATDSNDLIAWLRQRPIVHFDPDFNALLVHAGVLPQWSVQQIQNLAHEIEQLLRAPNANQFYAQMYGNEPHDWNEDLTGMPRIRFLINCFTRMRFCTADGNIDLAAKGTPEAKPNGFEPWFKLPNVRDKNLKIIFGHWAALNGQTGMPNMIGLDTGCVWGRKLTAIRLDDSQYFSIANHV
jgi:bis(5'-nucleosyl)-tetraphosphatase (symmetrical)